MVAQGLAPAVTRFGAFADILVAPGWVARSVPSASTVASFAGLMAGRYASLASQPLPAAA